MITLSVIVPIYHTAPYIPRCVHSILEQTGFDLEVILVNDGSTDESPAICDALAASDTRVTVLHKENGGLADARNTGMKAAHGEYITFVDSDDWLEGGAYQALLPCMGKRPDIVRFGYWKVKDHRRIARYLPPYAQGDCGQEALREMRLDAIYNHDMLDYQKARILSVCAHLFRRAFLEENHLEFESEKLILNEDYLFMLAALQAAASVYVMRQALYCYDTRDGSLTHSVKTHMFQRKQALCERYRQCVDTSEPEVEKRLRNFYIDCAYACAVEACNASQSIRAASASVRALLADEALQAYLSSNADRIGSARVRCIWRLMRRRQATLFCVFYRWMKAMRKHDDSL